MQLGEVRDRPSGTDREIELGTRQQLTLESKQIGAPFLLFVKRKALDCLKRCAHKLAWIRV